MTIREPGYANGADPSAGQRVERLSAQVSALMRDEMGLADAAERTREAVGQTLTDRWAKLAAAGVALIILMVIVRRVRRS